LAIFLSTYYRPVGCQSSGAKSQRGEGALEARPIGSTTASPQHKTAGETPAPALGLGRHGGGIIRTRERERGAGDQAKSQRRHVRFKRVAGASLQGVKQCGRLTLQQLTLEGERARRQRLHAHHVVLQRHPVDVELAQQLLRLGQPPVPRLARRLGDAVRVRAVPAAATKSPPDQRDRGVAFARRTTPKLSRCTCSPRHGLRSCQRDWAGVAKRRRELISPPNPLSSNSHQAIPCPAQGRRAYLSCRCVC
jgi:hypothetical protein